MTQFTYKSSSFNLDFYQGNSDWYAEVVINQFARFKREDGTYHLKSLTPWTYSVRVYRWDGDMWRQHELFTYKPKTKPKTGHLPDRTLTRLINERIGS